MAVLAIAVLLPQEVRPLWLSWKWFTEACDSNNKTKQENNNNKKPFLYIVSNPRKGKAVLEPTLHSLGKQLQSSREFSQDICGGLRPLSDDPLAPESSGSIRPPISQTTQFSVSSIYLLQKNQHQKDNVRSNFQKLIVPTVI